MNKLIAAAALFAAAFAAPVVPVQAATVSEVVDSCLVLPLLKKECWEEARAHFAAAHDAAVEATRETGDWKLPVWPSCQRAPAGSGHLFDC